MSWLQKLCETYEYCVGNEPPGAEPLLPVSHTTQQAQIEIILDSDGGFKRASVLDKSVSVTLIPCTEKSVGRTGKSPVNHPLCDKLQYVAGDYLKFGGEVTTGFSKNPLEPFQKFTKSLQAWTQSQHGHPKINAILNYVQKNCLIADLVKSGILYTDTDGKLLKEWNDDRSENPPIFKAMANKQRQENAFVRWQVEDMGSSISATWQDPELISAWINYYPSTQKKVGTCMVNGVKAALAVQHPAKLRHAADKAKLISSNDSNGYTFKGRFTDKKGEQACTIGFDVSQKAHNALRWLIKRQGYANGDQVFVSWATAGKPVPDPFSDTLSLFSNSNAPIFPTDTAQAFALGLNKAISGYSAKLDPTDDVIVIGLDSATPGRMAITFYRELKSSEFLERIEVWHSQYAWPQNFKGRKFIGAAAPRDIAEAAFGHMQKGDSGKKLIKATIERLLPCVIDGRIMPRDLVESITRRTVNRLGFEGDIKKGNQYEWEKCLGIACSLYKGFNYKEGFQMTLETDRNSRDYLFGRLLAVAENIEERALHIAKEKRETNAARLMQRFADYPYSTWLNIEKCLTPYKARLQSKWPIKLRELKDLLDEIMSNFNLPSDFTCDKRLTGEFLLGYHCQRSKLWEKINKNIIATELTLSQEN
jgi:CRISPR-associated protein Csd1